MVILQMSVWVGEKLMIVQCALIVDHVSEATLTTAYFTTVATATRAMFKWFLKCREESRHNELLSWVLLPLFEIVIKLVYRSVCSRPGLCVCVCLAGETVDGVTLRLAWDGQTVSCHSLPTFFSPWLLSSDSYQLLHLALSFSLPGSFLTGMREKARGGKVSNAESWHGFLSL